jgi:hypothetical protein
MNREMPILDSLAMTYHGHVQNGTIVLDAAPKLPEGAEVVVSIVAPPAPSEASGIASLYDRLAPVIGRAQHVPADFSTAHDGDHATRRDLPSPVA